jgi:hypothetical protein
MHTILIILGLVISHTALFWLGKWYGWLTCEPKTPDRPLYGNYGAEFVPGLHHPDDQIVRDLSGHEYVIKKQQQPKWKLKERANQ